MQVYITIPGEIQIVHITPLLHNIFLYMYGYLAETKLLRE